MDDQIYDNMIRGSILHSKMEQLLIPYKTVDLISKRSSLPAGVIKDKEEQYIRNNLKKWNGFSKDEKNHMREIWYEEVAVLDYLRNSEIIDDLPPADMEILWQENEEGMIMSCDIRLYYNNPARLGGKNRNVQKQ